MNEDSIAIVGQACRLPGAANCEALWRSLVSGTDNVRRFSDAELRAAGVDASTLDDPTYVKAFGYLEGIETFDAAFFGYTRREADLMDPQHRLLLECAWSVLESAGYRPDAVPGRVGVFAGSGPNRYLMYNLFPNESVFPRDGSEFLDQQLLPGSANDYLTSRISYKLGLTGPSLVVQTACSSSLAAVAVACDSLVEYGCDVALAGGVSIAALRLQGYHCPPGGMLSRSGACRPFSSDADGSVFGSGVGFVVLRRLRDALADGDHIHCIIRGWAVNNDGSAKAGFAAPSVAGQAEAAQAALSMAGVEASSIELMEAHGSGTPVGDPIEFEALRRVYGRTDRAYCALGSIKANVGHLDAAAGIAGLLKASLSLEQRQLPPLLHFRSVNPQIALDGSAFYVAEAARPWPRGSQPRRAAVNSTGLGGTNVHVVLEEAPRPLADVEEQPSNLLLLSARSEQALELGTSELARHLQIHPEQSLTAIAQTLALGRRHFDVRRALVANHREEAIRAFDSGRRPPFTAAAGKLAFVFAGVGDQYPGMALGSYRACAAFRAKIDQCAELFRRVLDFDLRDQLYPGGSWHDHSVAELPARATGDLDLVRMLRRDGASPAWPTCTSHPALFALEYSLAAVLGEWGLRPNALMGHSIGEYTAACIAGVMSLEDAVRVVATRARLCDASPEGAMLAVPLPEQELLPWLQGGLCLAAVNAPTSCVVSGPLPQILELEKALKAAGTVAVPMDATRAFHSSLMADAAQELESILQRVELRAPTIPFVSNVSGDWITAAEAMSPAYWGRQLCQTVRFCDGFKTLFDGQAPTLVEIGPGATLSAFAESYLRHEQRELPLLVHTVPASYRNQPAMPFLLEALGRLWTSGCEVTWSAFYPTTRARVPLPSYQFERSRHWIAAPASQASGCIPALPPSSSPPPPPRAVSALGQFGGVPAAGELETALAAIWCQAFGLAAVGATDDFFELGGHSFLALQVANEVWRRLRLDLPLHAILANPTIRQLSELLQRDAGRETSGTPVDLLALELAPRVVHLQSYIRSKLALFRGPACASPTIENELAPAEWAGLSIDLIGWFKRDFGVRLYPNELEKYGDPLALANHVASSLEAQRTVASLPTRSTRKRLPGAVFLLSSVRAGSTLLRVMLAGHPSLFSPPELHLLPYPDMERRVRGEASPDRDQGLIRAFAEATGISHEAATRLVAGFTTENCTTSDVYRRLQEACGERLLVDKSPGNANHLSSLRRAEEYFENPRYIWLSRHPYSVVDSVVRNRFTSLMDAGRMDPYQFGEFLWQRSNANIADFVEGVEAERVHRVKYEDLVKDPVGSSMKLCQFLGLRFDSSVVTPYEGKRMRDGLGDPNLAERSTIVAELADEWQKVRLPSELNRATRQLARELGYDVPNVARTLAVPERLAPTNVAAPPVALSKGGSGQPLHLVHPLDGNVFCYVHLARAFASARAVYGLEATQVPSDTQDDRSIEQLAADYVRRVRRVQPTGPYHLGGWSMGGILAYEMARQLADDGQSIATLLMIDSPAPLTDSPSYVPEHAYFVALYARFMSQRFQVDLDLRPEQLRALDNDAQLNVLWRAATRHEVMGGLTKAELALRVRTLTDNYTRVRRYHPRRYDGPATLVRAVAERSQFDRDGEGELSWQHQDGKYGWSTLVRGSLLVTDVDSDHYGILEPNNARALASLISDPLVASRPSAPLNATGA